MSADLNLDEGTHFDRKSLRKVVGSGADFAALAADCVCFANGLGGTIYIGIEDGAREPPAGQPIDPGLPDRIRKRVGELTVNVQVLPEVRLATNGGAYIALLVARSTGVASTSDGKYLLRLGDACVPVVGDDVMRLANDRPSYAWEGLPTGGVPASAAAQAKVDALVERLRQSPRVKPSVKEKSVPELLEHYGLVSGTLLTHLGVLLIGTRRDRERLGTAPVIQAIKYDERGQKVDKHLWDDYELSPVELIDAVWAAVPDFRETYELPDGLLRTSIPAFDEVVIREVLVNALVHRPYTQRGDIFLNLHPDRLEVVNPGRLPPGVTPANILHSSRRRNDGLARVFHDLQLMEREGSGFDLMFERLLTSGRVAPVVSEGTDSVHVTIARRVISPPTMRLLTQVDQRYQLRQRERIALALIAQTEGLRAAEIAKRLGLPDAASLSDWLPGLVEKGLLHQDGRTKGTRYFVPPEILRDAGLDTMTTLKRVEPHVLAALILEDVRRYPDSGRTEIHRRIGPEIHVRSVQRAIATLVANGRLVPSGSRRSRTYRYSKRQES